MEYVRFLSRELFPLTGKRPAKLHDPDLATLAAAGFGLWNPNAGALMLLPLGLGAADDVCRSFLQGLERTGLQPFPVQSLSERGPLEFAVRLLKRPGDLPRLFAERTNDRLTLQGFAEDAGSAADMASCALRALGQTLAAWGINVLPARRAVCPGVRRRTARRAGRDGRLHRPSRPAGCRSPFGRLQRLRVPKRRHRREPKGVSPNGSRVGPGL